MRQPEREVLAIPLEGTIPLVHRPLAVLDVLVTEDLVHRTAQRNRTLDELAVLNDDDAVGGLRFDVIGIAPLLEAALEAGGEELGRVGRALTSEQIKAEREPVVDVPLDHVERDRPFRHDVPALPQQGSRPRNDSIEAVFADAQMIGLLSAHELGGTRERIEGGLGESAELVLPVTISEHREHEEVEPVLDRLVEGAEDTGLLHGTGASRQKLRGLGLPVSAEVALEQVDHRPEVSAFLDIDLEKAPQVIEAGRGLAETALLLHRSRLGVPLHRDETPKHGAEFAGHLLPNRRSAIIATGDGAAGDRRREENPPAVLWHLHVVEAGPSTRLDRGSGAEIDLLGLEADRPSLPPPIKVVGKPSFKCALEPLVRRETDVVRNPFHYFHELLPSLIGLGNAESSLLGNHLDNLFSFPQISVGDKSSNIKAFFP